MEIISFLLGVIGSYFGAYPQVGTVLLLLLLDIVTGITKGIYQKKISSLLSVIGMAKKTAFLYAIALSFVINPYAPMLYLPVLLPTFFIWVEVVSIVENLDAMGVKLPVTFTKYLAQKQVDFPAAPSGKDENDPSKTA